MLSAYKKHNQFIDGLENFEQSDPHLQALSKLKYQYSANWWRHLPLDTPGIYILTGGRQVGKSTSCKLLVKHCLRNNEFATEGMFYLPCDEIYDAKQLSTILRFFLDQVSQKKFLLIIDEITFVKDWDRVIKALADEGYFQQGLCLLTGSDTLILKEAAMRFPGRRGTAPQTDFHLYPLSFHEYSNLIQPNIQADDEKLFDLFNDYLSCGGYLRAINDIAQHGEVTQATFLTYEQWIRGDFLRHGKKEDFLLAILRALMTIGVSTISFSALTQKIGLMSKETCIDYIRLLKRLDVLIDLPAFDLNKKQGFPRKDRKFHFFDPFIQQTLYRWLQREGYLNSLELETGLVEACVASHCHRFGKAFYFKGQGEVDVIWIKDGMLQAIEVKWSNQLRSSDLKTLKQFKDAFILSKKPHAGHIENIKSLPVYQFLFMMEKVQ